MIPEIPVTCANENAMMSILILNVPLMDSQGNTTVQNYSASLTTKEVAW
jgi:hypothetical protein